MVFFNYATMQMAAKIVYYGPGLCGKTTNLQYIYQKTSPKSRGEMVSLETETDRTLFFDLLPLDVGNIAGFKTRFQLYTVPGQVFYNSTRKLVLRGVDGIVFVADSQVPMMDANTESLNNLRANLAELGLNLDEIPLVYQFNKRDLKNISSAEQLNRVLNPRGLPYFEASALQGNGVFETLKGISKSTLITLRKRALGEERLKVPDVASRPAPEKPKVTPGPTPPAMTHPEAPPSQVQAPLFSPPPIIPEQAPVANASEEVSQTTAPVSPEVPSPVIVPEPEPVSVPVTASAVPSAPLPIPTAAEIAKEMLEFAQVAVASALKPPVKKIAVKTSDVASKLDVLRELYTGKMDVKSKREARSTIDPLAALLESAGQDKEKRITKKLKIRLDSQEIEAVKDLSVDFLLTGGNIHKRFSNAVNVSVEGKTNPKRVIIEIKLEILKK